MVVENRDQNKRITSRLKRYILKDNGYIIKTYQAFRNHMNKEPCPAKREARIKAEYSRCLIWLDEVHSISNSDKSMKHPVSRYEKESNDDDDDDEALEEDQEGVSPQINLYGKRRNTKRSIVLEDSESESESDDEDDQRVEEVQVQEQDKKRKDGIGAASKRMKSKKDAASLCNNAPRSGQENYYTTYQAFHNLLHWVERSKIVLSTATPMINSTTEMKSLINLLTPLDGCVPPYWNWTLASPRAFAEKFPGVPYMAARYNIPNAGELYDSNPDFVSLSREWTPEKVEKRFVGQMTSAQNLETMSLKDFEAITRGLFMYTRKSPQDVDVVNQGNRLKYEDKEYQMNVVYSIMSDFQTKKYLKFQEHKEEESFFQQSRQLSNFVYPDGTGKEGYSNYFSKNSEGKDKPSANLLGQLNSNLAKYSCKYDTILNSIKDETGIHFVYSEYVVGLRSQFVLRLFESPRLGRAGRHIFMD